MGDVIRLSLENWKGNKTVVNNVIGTEIQLEVFESIKICFGFFASLQTFDEKHNGQFYKTQIIQNEI